MSCCCSSRGRLSMLPSHLTLCGWFGWVWAVCRPVWRRSGPFLSGRRALSCPFRWGLDTGPSRSVTWPSWAWPSPCGTFCSKRWRTRICERTGWFWAVWLERSQCRGFGWLCAIKLRIRKGFVVNWFMLEGIRIGRGSKLPIKSVLLKYGCRWARLIFFFFLQGLSACITFRETRDTSVWIKIWYWIFYQTLTKYICFRIRSARSTK